MSATTTTSKQFYAKVRKAWRKWLKEKYAKEKNGWLINYHKSSAKPSEICL